MSPDLARAILVVLAGATLAGCWFNFGVLLLLWRRSRRIDVRNDILDRRVAAIGQVIVDLYPSQGPPLVPETRASKKLKALSILKRIDERDLDEARLAVEEITRERRGRLQME